jgi:hypothetical protein
MLHKLMVQQRMLVVKASSALGTLEILATFNLMSLLVRVQPKLLPALAASMLLCPMMAEVMLENGYKESLN